MDHLALARIGELLDRLLHRKPACVLDLVVVVGRRSGAKTEQEEADALAIEFGVTVAALEALASKMSRFLNEWEDLSFEQQTRRLVMTLFATRRAGE